MEKGKLKFSKLTRQQLCHCKVEDLLHFHNRGKDPALPMNKNGVLVEKISGGELIKFAARFAETVENKYVGVYYQHHSARMSANGHSDIMVLLNGSIVDIPQEVVLVPQSSIAVNGFAAIKNGLARISK